MPPHHAPLQTVGAPQLTHGVGGPAQPFVRHREIVVRRCILFVALHRRFVIADRFFYLTGFEMQIAQVHERWRKVSGDLQCLLEGRTRFVAPLKLDERNAALIRGGGAIGGAGLRLGENRIKARQGFLVAVMCHLPQREFVRRIERGLEKSEESAEVEHWRSLMFTIDVLTLFPEVFAPFVGLSIVGRAVEAGIVDIRYHHVLDALHGAERADDTPFGGGPGMVMRIEPLARILDEIIAQAPPDERRVIVVPTPAGERFTQSDARNFAEAADRLVFVCGHYEGIDDRLGRLYPIREYSLGDFVLTGGELPALAMMDATVRLLEGAVRPESLQDESFTEGTLDYPSYTRPAEFRGISVPEVLLSGNHAAIAAWRREQSRVRTRARRPDLGPKGAGDEKSP